MFMVNFQQWFVLCAIIFGCTNFVETNPLVKSYNRQNEISNHFDDLIGEAEKVERYLDFNVDPCDNFYDFACGKWASLNPIPADQVQYNELSILNDKLNVQLKEILEEGIKEQRDVNDAEVKLKYFYESCMDEDVIGQRNIEPLLELINNLGGWSVLSGSDHEEVDLTTLLARAKLLNVDVLFKVEVSNDLDNTTRYQIRLESPHMKIPARHDFLENYDKPKMIAYYNYTVKILQLLNITPSEALMIANDLMAFEKSLAEITADPFIVVNWESLYSRIELNSLQHLSSDIDWEKFFSILRNSDLDGSTEISTFDMQFLFQLNELLHNTDKSVVRNLVFWKVIRQFSKSLDGRFHLEEEKLNRVWLGKEEKSPRWKTCLQKSYQYFGKILSSIYVQRYFDNSSKAEIIQMTKELQEVLKNMILEKTWLDDKTKQVMLKKLQAIGMQIGYPDDILDPRKVNENYENLEIQRDKFFENVVNARRFAAQQNQELLYQIADRNTWPHEPAVINAYFKQTSNSMIIPAAVLQPPVYDPHAPRAVNYGRIGFFIGHELTHAFDEVGRILDLNGNMDSRQWSEVAIEGYIDRALCINEKFNNYELHGIKINGDASEAENVADSSGIKQAYFAYKKWLQANKDSNTYHRETLPGLNYTQMQIFFISYAQLWCDGTRPEMIENLVKTDEHCPMKFRIIGTLSNMPEFSETFHCPIGSPMNPEQKCEIW